jgi:hypothetical protein
MKWDLAFDHHMARVFEFSVGKLTSNPAPRCVLHFLDHLQQLVPQGRRHRTCRIHILGLAYSGKLKLPVKSGSQVRVVVRWICGQPEKTFVAFMLRARRVIGFERRQIALELIGR